MGCKECEDAQDSGIVIPYRWKHATVLIGACRDHGKEIVDILNEAQKLEGEDA